MLSEMSLFHGIALTVFSILAVLLTIFDVCLFVMAIKHRKDPHFPFAYLTVMSACGVICKAAFTINCGTYLLLSKIDYLGECGFQKLQTEASVMSSGLKPSEILLIPYFL
ncbi:hypothetical protein L3Y34_010050 [Caenorhabditis briggsae]|uniref:Uncharacterized protein n=1 Tax=Caenorhabditis briggsae TaxID=6238 RepID=A0AAE9D2A2_CAEBR|nr:hypothetical protein L3Y34_010050 [Caenorhabditis briggsae]